MSVILHMTLSSAGRFGRARIYPIQYTMEGPPVPGGGAAALAARLSSADFDPCQPPNPMITIRDGRRESSAKYPPFCVDAGSVPVKTQNAQIWAFCALKERQEPLRRIRRGVMAPVTDRPGGASPEAAPHPPGVPTGGGCRHLHGPPRTHVHGAAA